MAQSVAPSDDPLFTERWTIPFYQVPENMPNCRYQDGEPGSKAREYGRVLDTVYEMADELATANGTAIEVAIRDVLKIEGWCVLPSHQLLLATIYKFDDDKPIRLEAMLNRRHSYSIGTQRGEKKFDIEVVAWSRRAAARIALQNGFKVNDVNMVG